MAAGQKITNLLEMRDYLKRTLGSPVICVEVTDDQYDDIIYDSVQTLYRYLYEETTDRTYMAFPVTSGTSAYTLDDTILDVVDFNMMNWFDDINVLHSPTHMLLYNDWVEKGNYPGGPGGGGASLVSYDFAMTYFKEVQNQFSPAYTADYNNLTNKLSITPTPKQNGMGLLQVFKKVDAANIYNHPIMKALCEGKARFRWGSNIGKYSVQMPGGGTMNGSEIKSDGKTQIDETMALLKGSDAESSWPQFITG